ncbi:MAG: glycosyltransferase, partial [Chitinophagaceae bacterium]
MVKISICIPAYRRPENLQRLLSSIKAQGFKDYEIVITDDSPDDSVWNSLQNFSSLPISYHKNQPALGTPANWNRSIALATGEWIKLMHDDDWFRMPNSLQAFADATKEGRKFIFSRYVNVDEKGVEQTPSASSTWRNRILKEPLTLLATNIIGPPSVTLIHHSQKEIYDERMKWRVDLDLYIRLIRYEGSFHYIDEPLINVGISDSQVTNDCINLPNVELPEGQLLLEKYSVKPLSNLLVYDAWWRILRNSNTRTEAQLAKFTSGKPWPTVIHHMLRDESRLPAGLLRNRIVSKTAMVFSYLKNRK